MYRLPVYEGVIAARAQEESERAKNHSPAKAVRKDPEARVVDISAMSEFIEHK
jgi:hypothetical protein